MNVLTDWLGEWMSEFAYFIDVLGPFMWHSVFAWSQTRYLLNKWMF